MGIKSISKQGSDDGRWEGRILTHAHSPYGGTTKPESDALYGGSDPYGGQPSQISSLEQARACGGKFQDHVQFYSGDATRASSSLVGENVTDRKPVTETHEPYARERVQEVLCTTLGLPRRPPDLARSKELGRGPDEFYLGNLIVGILRRNIL
ncbi:hypothetical protein GQ457_15G021160 [Hibiscus cannabinus]